MTQFFVKPDRMGRIKLPKEVLEALGVGPGDQVTVELRKESLVLRGRTHIPIQITLEK